MSMINGRYYMNPGYGRALERARLAEAFAGTRPVNATDGDESWVNHAINYFSQPQRVSPDPLQGGRPQSQSQSTQDDTSWWDELIGGSSRNQVPPPPAPQAPGVNQDALEQSVDQSRNRTLTNHDVGLIVFQETKSFTRCRPRRTGARCNQWGSKTGICPTQNCRSHRAFRRGAPKPGCSGSLRILNEGCPKGISESHGPHQRRHPHVLSNHSHSRKLLAQTV